MFKYLFILLAPLILLSSSLSFAAPLVEDIVQKDSDVFFKLGGGARVRQYYLHDGAAGGLSNPQENINDTSHRLQLDVRLDKGEYFQTFFRLINANVWSESEEGDDELFIQQGYGQWKVSEFLNLRFGRSAFEIGRGLVYGYNEWEQVPTYYDGIHALFDWSALDISIRALKFYDLQRGLGFAGSSRPEVNHFMLDLSFKDISDSISMAEFSFVQIVGDAGISPNGISVSKQRLQRYGFDLVAGGVHYEVGTTMSLISGEVDDALGNSNKAKQLMVDLEAKWIMPEWNRFNFWVGAHMDSGDKDANDEVNEQYDPLNYNMHYNAGRMDFFRFGNLTFLRSGASLHFLSDWKVGMEYFRFQKTEAAGPIYLERSPSLNAQLLNGTMAFANSTDLGQEVDFWVSKTFQSGVNVELSLNYLSPGEAMKKAVLVAGNTPNPLDNPIYNVILDVGIFF